MVRLMEDMIRNSVNAGVNVVGKKGRRQGGVSAVSVVLFYYGLLRSLV